MSDENLYNLADEKINEIEKIISHAEIDATDSESFLDLVFPNLSNEDKAKIAIFSAAFVENYLEDDEDSEANEFDE